MGRTRAGSGAAVSKRPSRRHARARTGLRHPDCRHRRPRSRRNEHEEARRARRGDVLHPSLQAQLLPCGHAPGQHLRGRARAAECTAPWSAWSPDADTVCRGDPLTQTRTRSCPAGCNIGNCDESQSQGTTGTQPPTNCEWGDWGEWSAWSACTNHVQIRIRSRVPGQATCGGSACEGPITQTETENCCGTCNCTTSTTDGASDGICSDSGDACTVSANNCPTIVSCGADWPSSPTGTGYTRRECFGSGADARFCEWGRDEYRRSCAAGCNDGDCSEVRYGPERIIHSTCRTDHPRCR